MPHVTVQPSGIEIDVRENESVAEAAWRQGMVWPTKCWGQLECMSCFTKIVDGELSAVPATDDEHDAMRLRMTDRIRSPLVRLGCQLRVRKSGLVLEKQGVRPSADTESTIDGSNEEKVEGRR